ncbi:hypothetical protein BKA81DRAFT_366901 [Phyllosticta paracitricarpa]|uniref:Uncharacterized protein n=1 Tax=Phyllosticta citricarpa TaxID=55181 RepID=A0ABR1MI95_9PEZI
MIAIRPSEKMAAELTCRIRCAVLATIPAKTCAKAHPRGSKKTTGMRHCTRRSRRLLHLCRLWQLPRVVDVGCQARVLRIRMTAGTDLRIERAEGSASRFVPLQKREKKASNSTRSGKPCRLAHGRPRRRNVFEEHSAFCTEHATPSWMPGKMTVQKQGRWAPGVNKPPQAVEPWSCFSLWGEIGQKGPPYFHATLPKQT